MASDENSGTAPESKAVGAHRRSPELAKAAGAHKFDHGHAVVVAGPIVGAGAARLAARAALRIGAGLVTLAVPGTAVLAHRCPPDALMLRRADDGPALAAMLGDPRITAVVAGPALGLRRAARLVPAVLGWGGPCVLDADALGHLAEVGPAGLHARCVLTPHAGEFLRLCPDLGALAADDPVAAARGAAARWGATVCLKGPVTAVALPDGTAWRHDGADAPWLATAGSGDVLAGIVGGLLARGWAPGPAAAEGAAIHAAAARRFGPGLIADDLPELIPAVLRDRAG